MKPSFPPRLRSRLGVACLAIMATQFAACSSSNSGPSSTPPSNETPTPTVPPPATVSLTLEGFVTDEPIPNAVVTATVGGETFEVAADANGAYSLDIEIEEANADDFVTLHARGVGDQAFVEFTSLAGSFATLAAQAGDDGALSNDENFATQITNVSTAEAVLLVQANNGQPVTTEALRQSLSTTISGQDVLDLATAIKLAVDDPENYPLPDGQTSILELASNATSRQAFINAVYEQDPENFAAAQGSIAADPTLARPITAADLPENITAALMSSDANFTFNYSNRISSYDFDQDGTGFASGGSYDVAMTWSIVGTKIEVAFAEPVVSVSYDTENCGGTVRQVEAQYTSEGVTLSMLSDRMLAITETSSIAYLDCAALEDRVATSTSARTILKIEDFDVIETEELVGATQTIYVYDGEQGAVVADIADLEDGTGVTQLTGMTFTWELLEDGRIIAATFEDGSTAEYLSFGDVDSATSDILYEIWAPNDGPHYVDAGASVFVGPEDWLDITAEAVPGRYYQFGIGNETSPDPLLKGFRMRFDANGLGAQEDDYLDEEGALVTTNEITHAYNAFRWTFDDGDVAVRRTFGWNGTPANCELGVDANCGLWDVRFILPLTADGDRLYWLEVRTMDQQGVTEDTPTTSLVRFYDREPLSEAVGASKMNFAFPVTGARTRELVRGADLR